MWCHLEVSQAGLGLDSRAVGLHLRISGLDREMSACARVRVREAIVVDADVRVKSKPVDFKLAAGSVRQ
jgi:hypothetical protein